MGRTRSLAVLLAAATVLAVLTPAVGAADGTGIEVGLVGADSASPTLVVTVDEAPAAGADVTVDPVTAGRTYGGTGDYRAGADGNATGNGPPVDDDAGNGDGSPLDDPRPPGWTGAP